MSDHSGDADRFQTLAGHSEGLYREKGSRFIAYAVPVADDAAIAEKLDEIKRLHPKARHHCYAWRSGTNAETEFAQDAGEPSGSAGLPILNAMRSAEITFALVVVVRYFGGTKLGIPGLIRAYRTAAEDALRQNRIIRRDVMVTYEVEVRYENMDTLYRAVALANADIRHQEIGNFSTFRVQVPVREKYAFVNACQPVMEIRRTDPD